MESNIISLSGVQGAGKTTLAYHLRTLIPESVVYDGKREFTIYLEDLDKKGIVIISEYASSILFPVGHLSEGSEDRFLKCGLIDSQYFEKGKHFFLDVQSEKTQHERLLERNNGINDGYIRTIMKEYVHRSQYLRMLATKRILQKLYVLTKSQLKKLLKK